MDVTSWLLDSDPAIRWQVLRDLVGADPGEVAAERRRVATEGWTPRLLAEQAPDGYWGGHEYGEDGDRRGTHWTLLLLRRFGVEPDAPSVASAVDRVEAGVRWRHWDDLPYFHGEMEECVNGGVLAVAAYFGRLGDGSDRIVARLLDEVRSDGAWNCEPDSDLSSFDSTICVLEGLAAYERVTGPDAAIAAARRGGEEYLLERSLYRRRSTGEVVKPRYVDPAFPPYWFYDVLRALEYFAEQGGTPDPRLADPVELVWAMRMPDGRWPAGRPRPGAVFFAVDAAEGEPSRWNTLRALRVLRWWDAAAS